MASTQRACSCFPNSPPERDVQWTNGRRRGRLATGQPDLGRVRAALDSEAGSGDATADLELVRATHEAIKAVTEAIEGFRFNSAVARLYEFTAVVRAARADGAAIRARPPGRPERPGAAGRRPSPPIWRRSAGHGSARAAWSPRRPGRRWDPALSEDEERTLPVQINGKRRGEVRAPAGASAAEVEQIVMGDDEIRRRLEGLTIRKVIVVPDRIVNLVAG